MNTQATNIIETLLDDEPEPSLGEIDRMQTDPLKEQFLRNFNEAFRNLVEAAKKHVPQEEWERYSGIYMRWLLMRCAQDFQAQSMQDRGWKRKFKELAYYV